MLPLKPFSLKLFLDRKIDTLFVFCGMGSRDIDPGPTPGKLIYTRHTLLPYVNISSTGCTANQMHAQDASKRAQNGNNQMQSRLMRLVVKEKSKPNLKTAIMQYFTGTAANTIRLHSLDGINLDSLNSMYVPSNRLCLARPEKNLIAEGSLKESTQKRLVVKHRKYNIKTATLQHFINIAENPPRLHYHDRRNTVDCFGRSDLACVRVCVRTYVLTCLPFPERNLTGKRR